MSGVSVEDGKYVIVRGLGERYTTTALNGAVIPSAETDRKVVPLDLFPTNLLEGITTSKTFTPDQPGDFSGARVDLKTKEFPAGRQINIGVSAGFNSAVTGQNIAKAPTVSGDWFGNGAGPRALPPDVAAAGDLSGTNQAQLNTLIGSFRNVWAPDQGDGNGAGGFNASIGGEDPLFHHMFGYLASFSYAYAQEIRTDQTKGVTKRGDEVGTALPLNQYAGSSASGTVLWGGMLNFSTRIGANSKFDFNNTYTRGADNTVEDLSGFNEEFAQNFAFSRLTYIQRSVRTNQLVGNHLISPRNYLTWQVATSGVTRDEPDRSDIGYQARPTGPDSALAPYQWFGQTRFATRTWSTLNQSNWDLGANWQHSFGALNRPWNVKGGAAWRTASREVDVRAYDIVNQSLDQSQLQQAPEQIFSQGNIDASSFFMQANANGGRYDASEDVYAGYVQVEFPLTTRLQLVGGARLEAWTVNVASVTTTGAVVDANPSKTDILPSLGLNYALTPDQNLRFAATQTVSRPEYRELSPIAYFEQVGFAVTQGNPALQPRAHPERRPALGVVPPRRRDPQRRRLLQALRFADREGLHPVGRRQHPELCERRRGQQLRPRARGPEEPRLCRQLHAVLHRVRQRDADEELDHGRQRQHLRRHQPGAPDGGPVALHRQRRPPLGAEGLGGLAPLQRAGPAHPRGRHRRDPRRLREAPQHARRDSPDPGIAQPHGEDRSAEPAQRPVPLRAGRRGAAGVLLRPDLRRGLQVGDLSGLTRL